MGLFNFLRPKKIDFNNILAQMHSRLFPNGQKDITAVTDALLLILNHKISKEEAESIAVKSVALSRITEKFNKERLKQHLKGYCIQYFNDEQIKAFHGYLAFLIYADIMFGKTPSDVVGNGVFWVVK